MPLCFQCGGSLDNIIAPVARSETCPHCGSDVRVCKNCRHYDEKAYNECSEPQAERVLEKNRSNFCDYFSFTGGSAAAGGTSKEDVMKQLDDLFKK
ncbi:MAG: hypothetical protein KDD66_04605 [Bdellovibrionales bacterium]|nr:hypothetical protein [Bdellovibrionales bacterium]